MRVVIRLVLVALTSSLASASIHLPTDGRVRIGQYTAVAVDAPTTLSGPGLLTTVAKTRGIVPVLITGPATMLHYDGGSIPLTLLRPAERLVGSAGPVPLALFGRDKVIDIKLDPVDPLPGPPAAWTGFDAVVLDPPAWARLSETARDTLSAAGVRLIVTGRNRPLDRLSKPVDGGWEVLAPPSTPIELVSLDAYSPVRFWDRSTPPVVRRGVLATVLLASLGIGMAVAFRRTWAAVAVAILVTSGLLVFRHSDGRQSAIAGDVYVLGDVTRRDRFIYETTRDGDRRSVKWTGDMRPVFSSAAVAIAADVRIIVDDSGTAFDYGGPAGSTQCFVQRSIVSPPPWSPGKADSPMGDVAKDIYESPPLERVGRVPGSPWAGAVMIRRRPISP